MNKKIAIAGKGGTGKTTISALIIRNLIDMRKGSILALDADPNLNLNELLGIKVQNTIGQLMEDFKKDGGIISSGMHKDQMVEMNIHQSVTEGNGFDLLAMGRGEGPGCYCAANNLFKKYVDMLQENYSYVVMDNEAGMEHLSRKTTHDVENMLIVSDPSPRGILSASRIRDLTSELSINVEKIFLILNRVEEPIDLRLLDIIKKHDFDILGMISADKAITNIELDAKTVFDIPKESPSILGVKKILEKLSI